MADERDDEDDGGTTVAKTKQPPTPDPFGLLDPEAVHRFGDPDETSTPYAPDTAPGAQRYIPPMMGRDPRDFTKPDPAAPYTPTPEEADYQLPGGAPPVPVRGTPPPAPGIRAGISSGSRALLPGEFDIVEEFRGSQARQEADLKAREAEMEPLREAAMRTASQPMPEPPQFRQQPPPPDRQFGQAGHEFIQTASILAVIGSVIGRKHVTNAMAAFTGAMEGFREGKLEQAKIKLEDWKAESQAVIDDNKTMLEQYNAILKSQKMDLDQKMNQIQLVASKWQDRLAFDAASTKNIMELAKYLEQVRYHNEMLGFRRDELGARTDHWRDQINLKRELQQAKETGEPLSDRASNMLARQILDGAQPRDVLANIARGAQGRKDIVTVWEKVAELAEAEGKTPEMLNAQRQLTGARQAALRASYVQEAKVKAAAKEAEDLIPAAKERLDALNRGGFVPWNQLKQLYDRGTADPTQAQAYVAVQGVVTAYAAVMGRGNATITVDARRHAEELLPLATSAIAQNAALDQMRLEIKVAQRAPERARQEIIEEMIYAKGRAPPSPTLREIREEMAKEDRERARRERATPEPPASPRDPADPYDLNRRLP